MVIRFVRFITNVLLSALALWHLNSLGANRLSKHPHLGNSLQRLLLRRRCITRHGMDGNHSNLAALHRLPKWSYAWLIISFSAVIIIYWAQQHGLVPQKHDVTREELALSAAMIGLLCITQVMLVMTYDSANAQSMRYITQKMKSSNTYRTIYRSPTSIKIVF